MHRLTAHRLTDLVNRFRPAAGRSLFALTSRFGNSQSELERMVADANCQLYVDTADRFLMHVAHIDPKQSIAHVQFCGVGEFDSILDFLVALSHEYVLDKIYSFVFSSEVDEIGLLMRLGFAHEAVFREHLYLNGEYRDIEIYGRLGMTS